MSLFVYFKIVKMKVVQKSDWDELGEEVGLEHPLEWRYYKYSQKSDCNQIRLSMVSMNLYFRIDPQSLYK